MPYPTVERIIADALPGIAGTFAINCAAFLRSRESLRSPSIEPAEALDAAAHEAGHAITAAALGTQLIAARIQQAGDRWGGCVLPADSPRGLDAESLGVDMCACLGGYLGEKAVSRRGVHSSAHELALAMSMAGYAEQRFGIAPGAAWRASLTLTTQILSDNAAPFHRLIGRLATTGEAQGADLADCLRDVIPADRSKWVRLARAGGGDRRHQAEEEWLLVCDAIARALIAASQIKQ